MVETRSLALGLLLAAVVASSALAQELRLGLSADALTLDPGNHRNRETETILRNMYDGLLTRDSEMRLEPELAASWHRLGPLDYEFEIRDGVTFQDGSPLGADDVAFTFERLIGTVPIDGRTSPRKSLFGPLSAVEVVGPRTVRFHLERPWPQFPAMLPFAEIVSKRFVRAKGDAALAATVNGTGPFRLVEWHPGVEVVLQRFEGYYGGAPGIPPVGRACVERVVIEVIPNTESRIAALLAGDVQIIDQVPARAVATIERTPGVGAAAVDGTRSSFLALNSREQPFADRRMRRAVAGAIDRARIIATMLQGAATPIDGILSPKARGTGPALPALAFDPGLSRRLVAEAGYESGAELTLDVDPAQRDVAAAIADDLAAVGLRTKVAVAELAQLRTKWLAEKAARPGEMWLTSWGNASLDPVGIFDPTHRSDGPGNAAGYANPALDALLTRAAGEEDPAARTRLYFEAESIVNAELPYVYLWITKDIYGISDKVRGWRPSADGRINLHDACLSAE